MLALQPLVSLTENERAVMVAVIAGSVALVVPLLGALAAYLATKRQQRRTTYSEAVRAATAWKELLYRVRRRRADGVPQLMERFHVAQEELAYYEAWIGAESHYMAASYKRLVAAVKTKTEPLIQQAWKDRVRTPPGDAQPGDVHPDLEPDVGVFLQDVRGHLSPWPWRKLAVVLRNKKVA